jgi:hypothetical protein
MHLSMHTSNRDLCRAMEKLLLCLEETQFRVPGTIAAAYRIPPAASSIVTPNDSLRAMRVECSTLVPKLGQGACSIVLIGVEMQTRCVNPSKHVPRDLLFP